MRGHSVAFSLYGMLPSRGPIDPEADRKNKQPFWHYPGRTSPVRRGRPPVRPTPRRRAMDHAWCWPGSAGWGRGALQGYPGVTAGWESRWPTGRRTCSRGRHPVTARTAPTRPRAAVVAKARLKFLYSRAERQGLGTRVILPAYQHGSIGQPCSEHVKQNRLSPPDFAISNGLV